MSLISTGLVRGMRGGRQLKKEEEETARTEIGSTVGLADVVIGIVFGVLKSTKGRTETKKRDIFFFFVMKQVL